MLEGIKRPKTISVLATTGTTGIDAPGPVKAVPNHKENELNATITDPVLIDLYAQISARRAVLARAAAVLKAIDAALGARNFICSELRDYAELLDADAQRLRTSIVVAVGDMNLKKLGHLLASVEGQDLDGLEVHRLDDGADHRGVVWQVVAAGFSR